MDPDKWDLVNNEILRLNIQHHPNYFGWYISMPLHSRRIFQTLMEEDVTPELIELSLQSPDDEWDEFEFLRVVGGGNPEPDLVLALTNVVLTDIWFFLENTE
jgi:hypothetical protein